MKLSNPLSFLLPVKGMIRMTRAWNLLIIVFTQYLTAIFLVESGKDVLAFLVSSELFLLSLSSALIAAAGYIINDYYDVKIDLINKPDRVVVGRAVKRRVAMMWHTALNITGVLIGAYLSLKIGFFNLLSAALLWLYSNQLKRMPLIGNLSVALLTGWAVYVVAVLFNSHNIMVLAFAGFAFAFTLIREVIKDIEDVKGDATFGCRTLPVVYGIRPTKTMVYLFSLSFLLGMCSLAYRFAGDELTVFCSGLVAPLGLISFLLYKADTVAQYNKLSTYCKMIMLVGIISMVFF
ncbi:MAG: geranylgeranylglycerol-phosphate geranylgeranyltransferase [Bacteroidota bacterium]